MTTCRHFINGEYQSSAETFETVNPATGELIATVARGAKAEIDKALDVARETFLNTSWADMDGRLRGKLLRNVADAIRRHADEIIPMEIADAGKTVGDARAEVEIEVVRRIGIGCDAQLPAVGLRGGQRPDQWRGRRASTELCS